MELVMMGRLDREALEDLDYPVAVLQASPEELRAIGPLMYKQVAVVAAEPEGGDDVALEVLAARPGVVKVEAWRHSDGWAVRVDTDEGLAPEESMPWVHADTIPAAVEKVLGVLDVHEG